MWHIPFAVYKVLNSDDGQKTCLKHVEFHFKNKLEKLVHLVGFIVRISFTHSLTWLWIEVSVQNERSAAVPLVPSD
jgi:hypothetical protein